MGKILGCDGVIAFADSVKKCENELRSVFEEWVLMGLKLGHELPVIEGINLNKLPAAISA